MRIYSAASSFSLAYRQMAVDLLAAPEVDVGEWHSVSVKGSPAHVTKELRPVVFEMQIPNFRHLAQVAIEPNLPWAEEHFQERVSGKPLNPPPSHERWPFGNTETHLGEGKFSHTYPERFWPKFANVGGQTDKGRQIFVPHIGLRFEYGDLDDVVTQLVRNPLTRQAVLPVFFPEDTGAVHKERVPCSLFYQFIVREGRLHVDYSIRSCDFVRHFRDDVYMAVRLGQWVAEQLEDADIGLGNMGMLTMTIGSLHIFAGDVAKLTQEVENGLATTLS